MLDKNPSKNQNKNKSMQNNGRPKPMVPKTALKKNGNRYKCGGKLKK